MTASLKPALPGGAILSQNVEQDHADFFLGKPPRQRVLITIVQCGHASTDNQERGRVDKTKYELVQAIEVTDPYEVEKLRHLMMQERANRGLASRQPTLFDSSEDEQRTTVLGFITEWREENDVEEKDLDERWLSYFGGSEHAATATVRTGSLVQLKEFALYIGAVSDEPVKEPGEAPDDEAAADEVALDDPDDPADEDQADDDALPRDPGFTG